MEAFRVAYRLKTGRAGYSRAAGARAARARFRARTAALTFRFDFGGFLPRRKTSCPRSSRSIPGYQAINNGHEIVWQNGVLLRPAP